MVDDNVVPAEYRHRVGLDAGRCTGTGSNVPDDDVIRLDAQPVPPQRDAVARRRLSGNRDVTVVDVETAFQVDIPGNVEHDCPRPFCLNRIAQAARPFVGEGCHANHAPAAAAERMAAVAVRTREGQDTLPCTVRGRTARCQRQA